MNGKTMLMLAFVAGLFYCMNAPAVDRGRYEQYQGYKQRQQRGQQEVLEQARAAVRDWDFETAERQLATARNMAYAPDDLRAVEQLIADNRAAKAAKEERERAAAERARQEAEAQRQREAEQARVAAQQAAEAAQRQQRAAGGGGAGAGGRVDDVGVDASCIGGKCGGPSVLRLDLSGGPGNVSQLSRGAMISPRYDGSIAGMYHFEVVFGSSGGLFNKRIVGTICSGSVRVSGTKRYLNIRVYDDCDDAGTGEN